MTIETPPRLVKLLTRSFMADPYPALRKMQQEQAAVPIENGGLRMWVVTRYKDARMILADPTLRRDLVRNRHAVVGQNLVSIERKPKLPHEIKRSMLDQDGADHRRLRGVASKFFSPSALAAMRPKIEQVADDLLDQLPAGEPVDLVKSYARALSITCLSDLLGVPEYARSTFPLWETAILTASSKEGAEEAGRQLYALASEIIALKRAEPADDLFTQLVSVPDDVMDHVELISMITFLLIAGLEPASAIGSGVLALLKHPEELAILLANMELLPGCVDEILRYEPPFRMLTPRYLDRPLPLDGITIPAGELILVSAGAANRDPDRYEDPDQFRVTRCPKGHLGFGHGSHRCLGAELGRLEATIALGKLLHRFPGIRLAVPPDDVTWRPGIYMRRLEALPVVLA